MAEVTERLAAAHDRRRRLGERVAEHDGDRLRAVANALDRFDRLLEGYEDRATGTGNFETYIEFQEAVAELLETLDEDLPARSNFEAAADALEQRTLRPKHFAQARDELDRPRELAALLSDWEEAREEHVEARRAARDRRDQLTERIADLEDLLSLGDADLEAPVEQLRDPIDTYDEAVTAAVRTARRDESARTVLDVLDTAATYPLLDVPAPPSRLHTFLAESSAGAESIPTLLEWAEYSESKLDHYVDDPSALKRHVATNRTYLEGIDAAPFTIGWPPPPARELRWWTRETEAVLHRFASPAVIEHLRQVRARTRDDEYPRLREAGRARTRLGPEERERLTSGAVAADLETARADLEALEAALAAHAEA